MPKDASYHKAAIRYNEELAVFAENLSKKLENDEIKRWARSVSRQHKLHAGHHKKALKRLKYSFRGRKNQENNLIEDSPKSIEQEQADFAARMESLESTTPAPTPVENDPTPEPAPEPVENDPDPEETPEPVSAGVGTTSGEQAGGTSA